MGDDTLNPIHKRLDEALMDQKRLDWLEEQNKRAEYTGRCICRRSLNGRGWRLHETSRDGAFDSVRYAIDRAMSSEKVMKIVEEVFGDQNAKS